ncbi:hypothetical protein ACFLRC_03430, partial [Candidatus Altiarchaeota archaeon]
MLRPTRMCRIDGTIFSEHRDNLIEALHRMGEVQIDSLSDEDLKTSGLHRGRPLQRVTEVSTLILRIRRLIDGLSKHSKSKTTFLEDLLGIEKIHREKVEDTGFREFSTEAGGVVGEVEEVLERLEEEVKKNETRLKELGSEHSLLKQISNFKFPLEMLGESHYTFTFAGIIREDSRQQFVDRIKEELGKSFFLEYAPSEEDMYSLVLSVLKENVEDTEKIISSSGVRLIELDVKGTAKENIRRLETETNKLEKENAILQKEFPQLAKKHLRQLRNFEEILVIEKERCE